MSVAPSEALERSVLEGKDREQLLTIAAALGVKPGTRAKKADIIDKILEQVGVPSGAPSPEAAAPVRKAPRARVARSGNGDAEQPELPALGADAPSAAGAAAPDGFDGAAAPAAPAALPVVTAAAPPPAVVLGPDGEPLAEWELELGTVDDDGDAEGDDEGDGDDDPTQPGLAGQPGQPGEPREGRRRRRRRNRNRTGDEAAVPGATVAATVPERAPERVERTDRVERTERFDRPDRVDRPERSDRPERTDEGRTEPEVAGANEPVTVSGFVDLRDEGFGFLRVHGYLASKDDIYISVKQVRQYGLRRGDQVAGLSRPAGRNEKNPALLTVSEVNGGDPDAARSRRRFEDLTPLFPDEVLKLETAGDQTNMTARIIDLISPIGKGQRGLIVSPPKAGKTTVMKTIATAIERNHPEVRLFVLLIDERPEEVTDMRRTVKGEVIASTFDGKPSEHTQVAEMVIERAKRMVEAGEDVVVILDGITRLSRAYNLAAPASGKILSGGIDAGALYPPKKFFGAARNIEEGGSLTILATALVETNSKMDEAIFEEFKGTGNMELRLDRRLAERRIYPAIDVDASSTRHEELLFDPNQLPLVWKLRRVLSGLASEGSSAPGLELLSDRLKTFRTNAEFLSEIAKQPSM